MTMEDVLANAADVTPVCVCTYIYVILTSYLCLSCFVFLFV
jgi:hypothetical protein